MKSSLFLGVQLRSPMIGLPSVLTPKNDQSLPKSMPTIIVQWLAYMYILT